MASIYSILKRFDEVKKACEKVICLHKEGKFKEMQSLFKAYFLCGNAYFIDKNFEKAE